MKVRLPSFGVLDHKGRLLKVSASPYGASVRAVFSVKHEVFTRITYCSPEQ